MFLEENVVSDIMQRICIDNSIATMYKKMYLFNTYLFVSKLVGEVIFFENILEGCKIYSGSKICVIKFLGCMYEIVAEEDCIVKKLYVGSGQIIMYGSPLLLVIAVT